MHHAADRQVMVRFRDASGKRREGIIWLSEFHDFFRFVIPLAPQTDTEDPPDVAPHVAPTSKQSF
jgi:hypothetical protein